MEGFMQSLSLREDEQCERTRLSTVNTNVCFNVKCVCRAV